MGNGSVFPNDEHFRVVADALLQGNVVPFLGAGVNLWGRDEQPEATSVATNRLPSGRELARRLAPLSWPQADLDLLRVSQYLDVMQGSGPLYQKLREVFNREYPATPLHALLARLPKLIAAHAPNAMALLVVTTNYDDVLERALVAVGQEFQQIVYLANGPDRGLFAHRKWRKSDEAAPVLPNVPEVIRVPNEYNDPDLRSSRLPVVLKIHGAVDTTEATGDSYVITEDHYIDYLARADTSNFLPAVIRTRLQNSHILFLAYGLRDWNLRVVLRRIWGLRALTWVSWAIQLKCDDLDRRFWARHDVELIQTLLETYVARLERAIDATVSEARTRG